MDKETTVEIDPPLVDVPILDPSLVDGTISDPPLVNDPPLIAKRSCHRRGTTPRNIPPHK